MTTLLHILTKPEDSLATEVRARQSALSDQQVVIVDATVPDVDYARLLERIFEADSVAVW